MNSQNSFQCNPILAEVFRGSEVESFHRGVIAVVDDNGKVIASAGNIRQRTFMRSSAKPLQVIPLITSGAADYFGFDNEEIALMCGSHNGESAHTDVLRRVFMKVGLAENDLLCGVHPPLDKQTRDEMQSAGIPLSQIHNNCSGKHSAMLAGCVFRNYKRYSYYLPTHPWQIEIIDALSRISEIPAHEIGIGVDGCGVPVHSLPVYNAALSAAKFACPQNLPKDLYSACGRIFNAMASFPYMIGGRNRFCTDLISAGHDSIAAKAGAEGFYLVSIRKDNHGVGIAVKVDDGNERARDCVVLKTLKILHFLAVEQVGMLEKYASPSIFNHRGEVVGKIETAAMASLFDLS